VEILKSILDFILHIDVHLSEIISNYKVWTYLILFLIIFAETGFVITPFLPGDSLLFAAGAIIAKGNTGLDIYLLCVLLCIAAIIGNTTNYFLGSFFGARVFKAGNKILKLEYYEKTNVFFSKHGGKAVIFSRFMPIFRTIAPFVAGIGKMPFGRFTYFNIVGGLAWIISFLLMGFLIGNIPAVKQYFTELIMVIIVLTTAPAIIAAFKAKNSTN
jgi:membrane-associated protein